MAIVTAHIRHKLEILVNIDEPVAEINNIISAFLRLHPGRDHEILAALQRNIDGALAALPKIESEGGGNDE